MADCPSFLPDARPTPSGWKDYVGPVEVFHCGFRTILEDRNPTRENPINECVYDHGGVLVERGHPYAGCRGTPDQYFPGEHPILHATIDSGGIVRNPVGPLLTSRRHDLVEPLSTWLTNLIGSPLAAIEAEILRRSGFPR